MPRITNSKKIFLIKFLRLGNATPFRQKRVTHFSESHFCDSFCSRMHTLETFYPPIIYLKSPRINITIAEQENLLSRLIIAFEPQLSPLHFLSSLFPRPIIGIRQGPKFGREMDHFARCKCRAWRNKEKRACKSLSLSLCLQYLWSRFRTHEIRRTCGVIIFETWIIQLRRKAPFSLSLWIM